MLRIDTGYIIIAFTAFFFAFAIYAIFLGSFLPPSNNLVLDAMVNDKHYKYFTLFIIPTGAYFVIANWVGWQYYRNS